MLSIPTSVPASTDTEAPVEVSVLTPPSTIVTDPLASRSTQSAARTSVAAVAVPMVMSPLSVVSQAQSPASISGVELPETRFMESAAI